MSDDVSTSNKVTGPLSTGFDDAISVAIARAAR
jgi:hypothetical protein